MLLPLIVATSFLVTLVIVPIVIKVFKSINLLDVPDNRKVHIVNTPSLGGIAIYLGFYLALLFTFSLDDFAQNRFFLAGTVMIFLLGVRDDLSSLLAKHKLLIQIFASVLVVVFGGIKLEGLGGVLGHEALPWYFDEIVTIAIIVIMTNSFNLIDGIDGLAGSLGFVISVTLTWIFISYGNYIDAGICLAVSGGLLGFLLYNWFPSKIFMGDTGSMTTGFILSAMAIKTVSFSSIQLIAYPVNGALCITLFILPIYDTLRVVIIRLLNGQHPLAPDNNHLHHILLKIGFNHAQATTTLISYCILVLAELFFLRSIPQIVFIATILAQTILFGAFIDWRLSKLKSLKTADIKVAK